MSNYWNLSDQGVLKLLESGKTGLDSAEAKKRHDKLGPNSLPEQKRRSIFSRILDQFKDFLILLLIASALIALVLGEVVDAIAILSIVILNALIGFVQEYKAEQALDALKKREQETAKVNRSGKLTVVDASELVPGDLILVEAGDRVPADCRVLTSFNLKLDEAMLTGESQPVEKGEAKLPDNTTLGEQSNMLFKGTAVMEGKGTAVVVRIGAETEIGRIASLLEIENKEVTPLQKELDAIGKRITYLILGIAVVVFLMLLLRNSSVIEALLTSIALAVAAIPEGLPAIVAIVLSMGVLTLAKKKTIVRTLKAVETLGGVKYLLTDKTGTLTWNKINVVRVLTANHQEFQVKGEGYDKKGEYLTREGKKISHSQKEELEKLLATGVICNSAELELVDNEVRVIGDTTEGALLVAYERFGKDYFDLRGKYETINEEPFSSATKRMLSVVLEKETGKYFLLAKGAPEVILDLCEELSAKEKKLYHEQVNTWAAQGLRTLAFARVILTKTEIKTYNRYLHRLKFLGLVAQEDTVRKEAIEAVGTAARAGIETIMITGDHRLAALSIAKQVGIAKSTKQVMNGDELTLIEDDLLLQKLLDPRLPLRVFARVSPEQKLRLVNLIKDKTQAVVAVTGDGVNDAPSIKSASVGVAMGKSGSDVAKGVADIVLADDNYATLITGIFRGRVIFDNLIKFIRYLLSCNIGEVVVVFVGTLLGSLHIMLPIQLLFINLVTDSLPALALGFEKGSGRVLERQPRDPKERILNAKRWFGIGIEGLFIGLVSLGAFYLFLPYGFKYARTVAFLVLVVSQLLQAINSRDERETIFQVGAFGNRFLWFSIALSFALTYIVSQTAVLGSIFKTVPITNWSHWLMLMGLSTLVLVLSGIRKTLRLW